MNIKELKSNEIMPGFHGRILHGSDFTWVYWEIDKGSSLPEHNHVNEQLMHVVKGKFEFTISDVTRVFNAGELVVIDANELHSGKALTPCSVIDTFTPAREDYIQLRDSLI